MTEEVGTKTDDHENSMVKAWEITQKIRCGYSGGKRGGALSEKREILII